MGDKKVDKILRRWEYICVLCGEGFSNFYCCSLEHLKCYSFGGKENLNNLAPAHFYCNYFRQNESIISASKKLAQLKTKNPKLFATSINTPSLQKLGHSRWGFKLIQKVRPANDNIPAMLAKKEIRNLIRHYQTNELPQHEAGGL